jgi:hypothetical protein
MYPHPACTHTKKNWNERRLPPSSLPSYVYVHACVQSHTLAFCQRDNTAKKFLPDAGYSTLVFLASRTIRNKFMLLMKI